MRVVAYARASTAEQADSGAGLAAQRTAIEAECAHRGWEIVELIEDAGFSAKNLKRPGIQRALELLDAGEVDGLVVAKLDRLSRSMLDFTGLMARGSAKGWAIVALDCAVDTTTPAGEAMANVLATFAQFERRLIGQRTKDALAAKKAQGVVLGRPRSISAGIADRVDAERRSGLSLGAIAEGLTADGVPTAHGGQRWYRSTVKQLLEQTPAAA